MATFSSKAIKLAQESESKYGVPASVTLAQYALESGYGTSFLARTKNNYFGMKNGSKGWQSFNSMEDSFNAHGKLLSGERYASKTANAKTVQDYVSGIAETYAPSSDGNNNYAGQIMQIINDNNLTQYDTGNYSGSNTILYSSGNTLTSDKDNGSLWDSILSSVVTSVAVIFIGILAVVFFLSAFNIKIPSKKEIVSKAVKKALD